MERAGRYAFALLDDGAGKTRLTDALTVWNQRPRSPSASSTPSGRGGCWPRSRADITTDWGVRTLDCRHPLYEPLHYNNGAVWPFVTGFAAWAHYQARRGWAGYDLVRANAPPETTSRSGSSPS